MARKNDCPIAGTYLFENTYRFGSLVLRRAGNYSMMYEQFVERHGSKWNQEKPFQKRHVIALSRNDFYTGAGMVRAIPGPVFSIAAFTGGIAMKDKGTGWQLLGCLLAQLLFSSLVHYWFILFPHLVITCRNMRSVQGMEE